MVYTFQSNQSKFILLLFSRIWVALVGILFVPIYVNIIGTESYGLVAFSGTLAGSLAVLDLGLSTAINRQVAILKTQQDSEKPIKDLVFSVEIIYWGIALLAGLLVIILANPIAMHWVKAKNLSIKTIQQSIMLMGLIFAFQFPSSIYSGVLIGLEKQTSQAIINIIVTTLKAIGVIVILKLVSPTIEAFFIWQTAITLISTFALKLTTQKYLASPSIASFSKQQLKTIWRFAAGMTGISIITFFLNQIDKIVVSKFVTLDYVGYYGLAFMLAGAINQSISSLQPIVFPKFTALIAQKKQTELIALYHRSCRWVAIIVFPIGFTMILFASQILTLWTHNSVLTNATAPILQIASAGTICNCLMWMPYNFMLANGNTRFTIYQNIIASIILIPLLFWWTNLYGALGASFVWLTVNAGYVLITIPIFHLLYLKGELIKWYRNDVAIPFIMAGSLALIAKIFQTALFPSISILLLALVLLLCLTIYAVIIPDTRNLLFAKLKIIL